VTIRIRWLYVLTALICIIPCVLLCIHWMHKGFHDNLKSVTKYFAKHISNIWDKKDPNSNKTVEKILHVTFVLVFILGPEILIFDLIIIILYPVFVFLVAGFVGIFYLFFALLFVSEKVFILTALTGVLIGLGLNCLTVYAIAYHILIAIGSLWVEKVALTINIGGRNVQKER
jgi:hypothetical protein